QLIDHQLVPTWHLPVVVPGEIRVIDEAVPHGGGHRLGTGIDPPVRVSEDVLVRLPRGHPRYVRGPVAAAFRFQSGGGLAPGVEFAGDMDAGCERGPDAE